MRRWLLASQRTGAERPTDWATLEEPIDVVEALESRLKDYDTVLLDCLTLWVSNLLIQSSDDHEVREGIQLQARRLIELHQQHSASWIVVSNEVGLGVVPATKLGRVYADELGRVNQLFAATADDVIVMFAGLPVNLKALGLEGR